MSIEVTSPASDLGWEEREDALDLVPQYLPDWPQVAPEQPPITTAVEEADDAPF